MRFSAILITASLVLLCYVSIPYEYCYSLAKKMETASEINLYFMRNDFFLDCSVKKNIFLETNKDIVVHIDGTDTKYRNEELCLRRQ